MKVRRNMLTKAKTLYVLLAIGRVMCWSFIVNELCLCFLLCVLLNTGLIRACINGHRLVEVTYAEKALLYQSSRQHNIRHLACTTRPKGYFATMITRYVDMHSTFRLRRLLSCGNISKNSGPVGALNLRSNPRENSRNAC